MTTKTIGFIGLGTMGKGMALNLAQKGYPLAVYDINPTHMQSVVNQGPAKPAKNPGEVAEICDVTILSLPKPADVTEVVLGTDGIIHAARSGHVVIDTSTIDPHTSIEVAAHLKEKKIDMLDAPVAGGGPRGAAVGEQMMIVGGPREVFEKCSRILNVLGNKIVYAGENGKGLVLKLCFNIYSGMGLIAAAEAFVFGDQQGVDPCLIYEVITKARNGDWILENKCPYPECNERSPANNDFQPGFFLDYALKDYGFVISTIDEEKSTFPMISLTHKMFSDASDSGLGEKDASAIALYVKILAGVK